MPRTASLGKRDMNMTEGLLLGKMILFTIPVMASGLLQLLFNAADVMVVGKFAGAAAMAAVGCCGALINLIINLFIGLAVGAGVIAAQDIGAKRYDGVKKLVSTEKFREFLFIQVFSHIVQFEKDKHRDCRNDDESCQCYCRFS